MKFNSSYLIIIIINIHKRHQVNSYIAAFHNPGIENYS